MSKTNKDSRANETFEEQMANSWVLTKDGKLKKLGDLPMEPDDEKDPDE
ncbi:hypothetical protein KA005_82450 [bacterium]|nr:hypothetical protein [bacterium]